MSIIEKIALLYSNALSNIFAHIHSVMVDTITPFLPIFLSIYFLIIGYKWVIGAVNNDKVNLFRLFILLPFLIVLLFKFSTYIKYFVTPILVLKDYLVNAISSVSSETNEGNTFQLLDTIFMNIYTFVDNELMGNFVMNPLDNILGVLVLIIYGALYIWIGYFMIKSLVATSFFLMIGVIPLILFSFDKTKYITSAWLKSLVTYFLFAPISAFFMIFIHWITLGTSSNLEKEMESLFLLIVSGALMTLFVKDIPEYANALTSGMSGGSDATGAVGSTWSWGSVAAKNINKLRGK